MTLVLTGYPALEEALSVIRVQADEILVKPIEIALLRKLIREKLGPRPTSPSVCHMGLGPNYGRHIFTSQRFCSGIIFFRRFTD